MKRLILSVFFVLSVIFSFQTSQAAENGRLFINLTTDDTWRAVMALNFALESQKVGKKVTVFLNVRGVHLGIRKAKLPKDPYTGKRIQNIIKTFIAKGGRVYICKMCMKIAGYTEDMLVTGIKLGEPRLIFKEFYDTNTKIITY
jgi:predicted peroxiredoxin